MESFPDRLPLRPGPYLVVGLARSGQAAARLLAERGEEVVGVDSGSPSGAEGLGDLGVEVHLNGDGSEFLPRVSAMVKSPGVPDRAPAVAAAREQGLPVISELELAWRMLPNPFVAVTGTNGKTTVVEWLGHVWREARLPAVIAGNVGTPVSSLSGEIEPETTVICECSSFQLEDLETFRPHVAVLLNLTPDHIDRHGTLEAYREAKLGIFAAQRKRDFAVFDADQAAFVSSERGGRGATIAYGSSACAEGGCLVRARDGVIEADGEPICEIEGLALPGEHNLRNAMAVTAAALCAEVPRDAISSGLRSFGGVPHRLERIAEIDGVTYVNDSKATNVAAAEAALRAYDGGVHAILGGSLKGGEFSELATAVGERCRAAYLIGEAAPTLERDLADSGVELIQSGTVERAVEAAAAAAVAGDVVLLAPACASFDAFRDYEDRGDNFRSLVEALR